jgi:hypothetical protein
MKINTRDLCFFHGTGATAAAGILSKGPLNSLDQMGSRSLASDLWLPLLVHFSLSVIACGLASESERRGLSHRCRPLLQDARPLPYGQPYPGQMLDRRGEDLRRLVEVAPGINHALDPGAFLGLLLDLVVVVVVREKRLVGLFVGPVPRH